MITLKNAKGDIKFPHRDHQGNYACTKCHHKEAPKTQPHACKECHGKAGAPSMKDAGHGACKDCHKKEGAPTGCGDCHGN
ncbi:MAG: hypothetical protein COW42_01060 [Deltaproteobacteria bacterium CG17_big_fil_post_rev_8_21_14_2_50_63_7]|nr:MAG: hypothetical protein COW42_01060 [Deltaproteobacteria bacterium CG17_big_fil_post_rev_8_21_14_2_50_63_7]